MSEDIDFMSGLSASEESAADEESRFATEEDFLRAAEAIVDAALWCKRLRGSIETFSGASELEALLGSTALSDEIAASPVEQRMERRVEQPGEEDEVNDERRRVLIDAVYRDPSITAMLFKKRGMNFQ